MENKLKELFDYQSFEKDERLEKLIRETEIHYARELSDDDLLLVNAAGELAMNPVTTEESTVADDGSSALLKRRSPGSAGN